jgi:hypothetical protein
VRGNVFCAILYPKVEYLPRQARDKHRKSRKRETILYRHKNDPCSDKNGTVIVDPKKCSNGRRTGRFTTKDFVNFTHAVQAFNGTADYEIYTVQPFRLPSYRKGYCVLR